MEGEIISMGKLEEKTIEDILVESDIKNNIKRLRSRKINNINDINNGIIKEYKLPKGYTIPILRDVIFKYLFVTEPNIFTKILVKAFDIKEAAKDAMVMAGYESISGKYNGKNNRCDILIRINPKNYINIEMNSNSDNSVLERNLLQIFRICGQVVKKGESYKELKHYRIILLNLNKSKKSNKDEIIIDEDDNGINKYVFYNLKTAMVASNLVTIYQVDVEKCKHLLYNNNEINETPLLARLGAISDEYKISRIMDMLGDAITMDEKNKLSKILEDINDNDTIVQNWIFEENARLKYEGDMETSFNDGIELGKEEGIESSKLEMIKNMLKENYEYESISKISGKTIDEIKEVEESIKEES